MKCARHKARSVAFGIKSLNEWFHLSTQLRKHRSPLRENQEERLYITLTHCLNEYNSAAVLFPLQVTTNITAISKELGLCLPGRSWEQWKYRQLPQTDGQARHTARSDLGQAAGSELGGSQPCKHTCTWNIDEHRVCANMSSRSHTYERKLHLVLIPEYLSFSLLILL